MPAITGIAAHHHSPPDGSLNILKRYRLPLPLPKGYDRSLKSGAHPCGKTAGKQREAPPRLTHLPAFMHCSMVFAVQLRILRRSKTQRGGPNLFAARKNIELPLSEGLHTPRNCRIENL